MKHISLGIFILIISGILSSCHNSSQQTVEFPYYMPKTEAELPDGLELSTSMKRVFETFHSRRPEENELFSTFKYFELKSFDYNNGDGTITRRDPSRVIKVNNTYYVYYTYRHTKTGHLGPKKMY